MRSVRLHLGDVVLVKTNSNNEGIGLIKYVGPMVDHDVMSDYVGIELLEAIANGHNGTIDRFTYFTTSKGHGFHTKMTNVIKKLSISDLFTRTKKLSRLFQKKLKYIKNLESKVNTDRSKVTPLPSTIDHRISLNSSDSFQSMRSHSRRSWRSRQSRISRLSRATTPPAYINKHSLFIHHTPQSTLTDATSATSISTADTASSCSSNESEEEPQITQIPKIKQRQLQPSRRKKSVVKRLRNDKYKYKQNHKQKSNSNNHRCIRAKSYEPMEHAHTHTSCVAPPFFNMQQAQSCEPYEPYTDYLPMANPSLLNHSKSTPVCSTTPTQYKYNHGGMNVNYGHGHGSPNNLILTQSNTQIYAYSTPSHSSMGGMIMLNNGYVPYDSHSMSYVTTTPTQNSTSTSLTPYMASVNEYYHRSIPPSPLSVHHNTQNSNSTYQIMQKNKLNEVTYEPNHRKQSK